MKRIDFVANKFYYFWVDEFFGCVAVLLSSLQTPHERDRDQMKFDQTTNVALVAHSSRHF